MPSLYRNYPAWREYSRVTRRSLFLTLGLPVVGFAFASVLSALVFRSGPDWLRPVAIGRTPTSEKTYSSKSCRLTGVFSIGTVSLETRISARGHFPEKVLPAISNARRVYLTGRRSGLRAACIRRATGRS